MRLVPIIIIALAGLTACSARAPVANIKYLGLRAEGNTYHLKFASDQPILELFAKNKHQRVVFKELICSLNDDHNFDVEHQLKYFAQGGIELVEKTSSGGKLSHVFESDFQFWQNVNRDMATNQYLAVEELHVLLKGRDSIPCRVRMTVYLSSPYYSGTMLVPAKDILAVTKN